MKRITSYFDIEDLGAGPDTKRSRDRPQQRSPVPSPPSASAAASAVRQRACEVVSCSRRTDVPAFHLAWALDRMRAGHVDVANPRNASQVSRVSLSPADVRCWAWWSKDYSEWLEAWRDAESPEGRLLRSYDAHVFNFTINTHCAELEPGVRSSLEQRLGQLAELAREFGPRSVVLRFDPVVHWRPLRAPAGSAVLDNLGSFDRVCEAAAQAGVADVTMAFCLAYPAVRARMRRRGLELVELPPDDRLRLARELARRAAERGVQLRACSQPSLVSGEVAAACCIDGERIDEALAARGKRPLSAATKKKDPGQRATCRCVKSADIGGYGAQFACRHSCVYCYANPAAVPATAARTTEESNT
eukprot:m51a1_g3425 hypothetical protein (360) ;mRNA; f:606927-608092